MDADAYRAGLRKELADVTRAGKTARIKAVQAEIDRVDPPAPPAPRAAAKS